MKIPRPPRHQAIGFWLSMPFITLALLYIMYGARLFDDFRIALAGYPVIYAMGYLSWFAHTLYDYYLRRRFPTVKQTRQRVLYKMLVNIMIMTPSVMLIFLVFHVFHIMGYRIEGRDLLYGYLAGLTVNIIFESLWEVIYIIDRLKEAAAEKEMIEQMQLRQEFDNLKQKVNPHFLFNSFNTLSSLISENKNQAEKFLDELSKVYRYLLRSNETGMSTVEQETNFIKSYSKLLETRFGEGFKLDMDIAPQCRDKEIPSLTLQLLVENAVKHNIITKQNPVQVTIRSNGDGYLTVENNLNKKTRIAGESTGIGLSNIREKYKLLNRYDVDIRETAETFKVTIPLIK
jgi:sensor histidine kinase YesM